MTKKSALGIRVALYAVGTVTALFFGTVYFLDNVIHDGRMLFPVESQGMPLAKQPSLEVDGGKAYVTWSLNTVCTGADFEAVTDDYRLGREPHAWFGGSGEIDCLETASGKMDCRMALDHRMTGYLEQGRGLWVVVKGGGCRTWPYTFYKSGILEIDSEEVAALVSPPPFPYRERALNVRGEFAVGDLGPKDFRAERERLSAEGGGLWAGGAEVSETDVVRQSSVSQDDLPEGVSCGPWSRLLFFGGDRYLICQAKMIRLPQDHRFEVYRNGVKQTFFFYGQAGADGVLREARMIGGELALTVRTPDSAADLILGGRLMSSEHTLSGGSGPFEYAGNVGFVAERGDRDFVLYGGQRISRDFDEIRTLSCCAITPYPFAVYDNGILEFVGRRGDEYYLVEIDLNNG